MKENELKTKISALFSDSSAAKTFENHIPPKVSTFLLEVAKGHIDLPTLNEDIAFARSISSAIQH